MALKLHRCSAEWVKIGTHPCWKVQKVLDEEGVEYEEMAARVRVGTLAAVDEGPAEAPPTGAA